MDALVPRHTRYLTPHEGDAAIFAALNQHGPLSSPMLYLFVQEHFASLTVLKNRLTALTRFDNTPNGGVYLWRPAREFYNKPITKHDTYANSKAADTYLLDRGLAHRPSDRVSLYTYPHEYFLSNVTASIELSAKRTDGVAFLSEHALMHRIPSGTREMHVHIEYDRKFWDDEARAHRRVLQKADTTLQPDAYFSFSKHHDGRKQERAFFLEVDRNTENLTKPRLQDESWLSKILKYRKMREKGDYKEHFGITCPAFVLVVAFKRERIDAIKKLLLDLTDGRGSNYFLFRVWHDFSDKFHVPAEPNYSLFDEPWERVGTDPKTSQPYAPFSIGE